MASGCGSVGRAVASNSRGPRFESSHRQKFILNIYCQLYRKDENKKKEAEIGAFKKKHFARSVNVLCETHTRSEDFWRHVEDRLSQEGPNKFNHGQEHRGQFHKTLWIRKLWICSYGQIMTVNLLINCKNSVIYFKMAVNYEEKSFME